MSDQAAASAASEPPESLARILLALGLTWLLPGTGHLLLGRVGRALCFAVLVVCTLAVGCWQSGEVGLRFDAGPIESAKSLARVAIGGPYILLRAGLGYGGDLRAPGYEYGSAFVLTAGLMSLLLMLDVWDIGRRRKT